MSTLLARYHDFEVETAGPWYSVRFPVTDGSYYICHTRDHAQAVKEVGHFIDEAREALEELEALG